MDVFRIKFNLACAKWIMRIKKLNFSNRILWAKRKISCFKNVQFSDR